MSDSFQRPKEFDEYSRLSALLHNENDDINLESISDTDSDEESSRLPHRNISIVQQLIRSSPFTTGENFAKPPLPQRSSDASPINTTLSSHYRASSPVVSYSRDNKLRLWPSLTDFYREILSLTCSLQVPDRGQLGKRYRGNVPRGPAKSRAPELALEWSLYRRPSIRPISTTFNTIKQYTDAFEPLVLEECRLSILHAYGTRYTSSSSRQSAEFQTISAQETIDIPDAISKNSSNRSKLKLLRIIVDLKYSPSTISDDSNICPGDVLLLYSAALRDKQHILGFVMGGDSDYEYLTSSRTSVQQRNVIDVLICIDEEPATIENCHLAMISIGSIVTSAREFQALRSVPHLRPNAQSIILNPTNVVTSASPDKAPVSKPLWHHLATEYNGSQLDALRAVCSPPDTIACAETSKSTLPINLRLLHGPPGAGKSQTILGMLALVFGGGVPLHQPGSKSGKKVSIGASLAVTEQSKAAAAKPKVLLCAPSNTAVDELAVRLLRHGVIGDDGQPRPLNVVRLGQGFDKSTGASEEEQEVSDHCKLKTLQELSLINFDYLVEQRKKALSSKGSLNTLHRSSSMAEIRQDVLETTDILCCTLSGAGSHLLLDSIMHAPASQRDGLMGSTAKRRFSGFDVVIIDEACQAVEPSILIPLKFEPQLVVMVGDPMQLPPTVLSQRSKQAAYARSLFQRLEDGGYGKLMLNIQYRMHPEISHFASKRFYDHKLLDDENMTLKNSHAMPFHSEVNFRPFLLYSIRSEELSDGFSFYNVIEAEAILALYDKLRRVYADRLTGGVGIIAAYKGQEKYLRSIFRKAYGRGMGGGGGLRNFAGSTEISTVDGFQGREKDVIILSFVRSRRGGQVGFLNDRNRINVALTRAKYGLWIVGDIAVMEQCGGDWAALARTMLQHGLVLDRV